MLFSIEVVNLNSFPYHFLKFFTFSEESMTERFSNLLKDTSAINEKYPQ